MCPLFPACSPKINCDVYYSLSLSRARTHIQIRAGYKPPCVVPAQATLCRTCTSLRCSSTVNLCRMKSMVSVSPACSTPTIDGCSISSGTLSQIPRQSPTAHCHKYHVSHQRHSVTNTMSVTNGTLSQIPCQSPTALCQKSHVSHQQSVIA